MPLTESRLKSKHGASGQNLCIGIAALRSICLRQANKWKFKLHIL